MTRHRRLLPLFLLGTITLGLLTPVRAAKLAISRIYIEYNSSANDLGFHVFLDGEDWKTLEIVNPAGITVFEVEGSGGYQDLGLTELFFEGAEPPLDEVPLEELLALFPEGKYQFIGETVGGARMKSTATLSHAVPDGPSNLSAVVGLNNYLTISWDPVTGPPEGFPDEGIQIVGYQVIVGDAFQVTVPDTTTMVTVSPEYVESLGPGEHAVEVLAIEESGNQTITEGSFELEN